jgi:hypothetical protein
VARHTSIGMTSRPTERGAQQSNACLMSVPPTHALLKVLHALASIEGMLLAKAAASKDNGMHPPKAPRLSDGLDVECEGRKGGAGCVGSVHGLQEQ